MIAIAILSSPPGLSRISMIIPFRSLKSRQSLPESSSQSPLTNAFQLEDPNVAEFLRPAVAKHPGLGRRRPPETIVDKSFSVVLKSCLISRVVNSCLNLGCFSGVKYRFFRCALALAFNSTCPSFNGSSIWQKISKSSSSLVLLVSS